MFLRGEIGSENKSTVGKESQDKKVRTDPRKSIASNSIKRHVLVKKIPVAQSLPKEGNGDRDGTKSE